MAEKKKEDLFNAIEELEKLGKKKGVVSMQEIQDRLSHFEAVSYTHLTLPTTPYV